MCKVAHYDVRVIASSGDNVRITVELWHSPDGQVPSFHSVAINAANPGTSLPALVSGDADQSKIIGDALHVVLKIKDSAQANAQWALIEVFELRKPF